MGNTFGFPIERSSGGDFLPIVKYDARAGRIFRVDRVDNGGGYKNDAVDITPIFKALADFENLEVGWINFQPGSAPDFKLVPIGTEFPDRPSAVHKQGVRFMLKLPKDCCGDKPIREIAGNSVAFLSGIEAVYDVYLAERGNYPGKLPVITLVKTTLVKNEGKEHSSANYHPTFGISGWAPRGDLLFVAKGASAAPAATAAAVASQATAPTTGSTRAEAPKAAETISIDEFG
ncbi:hypothetical protein CT676_40615 [Bradyrhizobium sp. MOS001]|uniref:hypothetical protein n=1 Tax=unclassified Bradyrhizobium TaxID=2631580 RepID=UPI0010754B3D|nr:hypothetical protein [Bradyrhizobium sp. MOS001]TFW53645.1 hypothetical protein CT676_40615 [Bradyrhizobium sp. MOS001]